VILQALKALCRDGANIISQKGLTISQSVGMRNKHEIATGYLQKIIAFPVFID
jgi:hypothetical protein